MCRDPDPRSYLQVQGYRTYNVHTQKWCMSLNSSLPCWIWIIFHTIVVRNPTMCHDPEPRPYLRSRSLHTYPKICVWALTPHCHVGSRQCFTQLLSMAQGCVVTLTQGHISKFKVTEPTMYIPKNGVYASVAEKLYK